MERKKRGESGIDIYGERTTNQMARSAIYEGVTDGLRGEKQDESSR